MKCALTLVWLLTPLVATAADWTPPEDPDPQAILQEAKADRRAKRFDVALAKHVWFHEHALDIQPSLSAVRLSFALSHWIELGDAYPPALARLKEFRDEARRRVTPKEGSKVKFDDFQELAAINRALDEESVTVDAFLALDADNPDAAGRMFHVAQPALVKAKEYALCGKYIETDKALRRIVDRYRLGREMAENPRFGARHLEFAVSKFRNEAAMLVALLVVNDRTTEADHVVREVKAQPGSAAFHEQLAKELDKALAGTVPKLWP